MHVLFGRLRSRQRYTPADITPYMRINGYPPESPEYRKLAEGGFADWRLKVEGLVERPAALSLADLRALPRQEQITMHNCIQGWSGIVQWAGVQVMQVLELCRPLPSAQYIVFYAFMQEEYAPQSYYEAFSLKEMDDPQTILAYEMNWRPLPIPHGAPCRLRIETKVGYKMVKYLRSIELVTTLNEVGEGHGGYREDYQYYDKEAMI
ncbi:MAG: molybdopterin-binding protein [Nitrospiraceae bacterium]